MNEFAQDCTTPNSPSPLPIPSPMNPPPSINITPPPLASKVVDQCSTTIQNCQCKSKWEFVTLNGKTNIYHGCANPDQDPLSPWCIVDIATCPEDATFNIVQTQTGSNLDKWDRCSTDCDQGFIQKAKNAIQHHTKAGCTCQEVWEYNNKRNIRCSNPDSDPLGNWCKVIPESCSSQIVGGSFVNEVTNKISLVESWDYCI
eukprot:TRINITY_DN3562_c0_g1_i3.p3 TRINITY_DN3562_c0_g1~~TRINITY_DN3562_c0_g1_i3.p3  ORF type:complete len:201 (-),score=15.67 TRINITY_DN3562_c0_g1_i3:852-1454(-)